MQKENKRIKQSNAMKGFLFRAYHANSLETTGVEDPEQQPLSNTIMNGFTLIELLVVVLIIGILAAIALPQYQKAVVKSRAAKLQAVLTEVVMASDLYYLHHGVYPQSFNDLDIDIGLPTVEAKKTCASWAPNSTKQGDDFEISIFNGADIKAISAHFTTGKYKCRGFIHYYKNNGNHALDGKTVCGEYYYNLACGSAGCELGAFCNKILGKKHKAYTYQVNSFQ